MAIYKNNYDHSSTGTDIEFYGRYDGELSELDFRQNFTLAFEDTYFYTDWGMNTTPEVIGDIFKIKKGLKKKDLSCFGYGDETRKELEDDILSQPIKSYPDYEDILELKKDFKIIKTTGYCQGDVASVILHKKDDISKEDIDNLFWDCPICANFTIKENIYDYEENPYTWNPDAFCKKVSEESGVPYETLRSMCPDCLDY